MTVVEVAEELKQMSNAERLFIIETAAKLLQKELNAADENIKNQNRLRESALIMESEYLSNEELTAVTKALEYEDFYDA